jgi:hypothetical protein
MNRLTSLADHPRRTDCPASPTGLSAQPCTTKSTRPNGSKESRTRTHEEHDELLAESLLADRPPGRADRPRGAQTAA